MKIKVALGTLTTGGEQFPQPSNRVKSGRLGREMVQDFGHNWVMFLWDCLAEGIWGWVYKNLSRGEEFKKCKGGSYQIMAEVLWTEEK